MKAPTKNGTLNLFARVEQGGLGISCPPGIEPGGTLFQQALAHHLRRQLFDSLEEEASLGPELNLLVGLPEDFSFLVEKENPKVPSVYATPRPSAKATARWHRTFGKCRTSWSLVPVMQPCRQYEHRLCDLPSDEPEFLSYQLPWEFSASRRFYFRVKPQEIKAAHKTTGRLADPGHFPWELRRIASTHEVEVQRSRLDKKITHHVLGWKEGEYEKLFGVPIWERDYAPLSACKGG